MSTQTQTNAGSNGQAQDSTTNSNGASGHDPNLFDFTKEPRYALIQQALASISTSRIDSDQQRREIGMALYSGYDGALIGLALYDGWCKQSPRHKPGMCAAEWIEFESEWDGSITLDRLYQYATADNPQKFLKPAPKKPRPSHYMKALRTLNYDFSLNQMNDVIYVNSAIMGDVLENHIMVKLREKSYDSKRIFTECYYSMAYQKQFHPVRDYLLSRVWDGQDHIEKISQYVLDRDDLFRLLFTKWMVGAVEKILTPSATAQNPILIFAGPQEMGKSVFVSWLGGVLPEYFNSSGIHPEDKDHKILQISVLVWEVKEISGSLRKSEIEAMKGFIDQTRQMIRVPYGRKPIQKWVTASYIGTTNPDGVGFLNDTTGNRRFRVCRLEKIDWDYAKNIDPNQLWAQAVSMFVNGERYGLTADEEKKVNQIKAMFEYEDPIEAYIDELFEVTKDPNNFIPAKVVLQVLQRSNAIRSTTDVKDAMRISRQLTKRGAEGDTQRLDDGTGKTKPVKVKQNLILTKRGIDIVNDTGAFTPNPITFPGWTP